MPADTGWVWDNAPISRQALSNPLSMCDDSPVAAATLYGGAQLDPIARARAARDWSEDAYGSGERFRRAPAATTNPLSTRDASPVAAATPSCNELSDQASAGTALPEYTQSTGAPSYSWP